MIKEYYGEKRFEVSGYYDDRFRGLSDSDNFDDFDEVVDYAHGLLMDGNNVLIVDTDTGNELKIRADEYQDNFDGDFAVNSAIYDFEQSIWNNLGESRNCTMSKRRMTEVNKGYSSEVYQILDDTFVSEWDNTVDPDYLADDVDISLFNNGDMYDAIRSTRRKATSVAYEALLYVLQCAVKDAGSRVRVTSEMAKQWLKKHGINYIDLLAPVVDHIEEYRAELNAEKNESLRNRRNRIFKNTAKESMKYSKRKGRMTENRYNFDVDGYAVQIHDMNKGYVHLFEFGTKAEADEAYDMLNNLWLDADDGNIDDVDYELILQDVFDSAREFIEEIDWRRNIDKNNIYNYGDGKIQIVNDVAIPIYM